MDRNTRLVLIVGGAIVALFAAGVLGYALGRPDEPETASVAVPETIGSPPIDASPEPALPVEDVPALTAQGAVLDAGGNEVTPGVQTSPCQTLITPGRPGECGEAQVQGGRVVWTVEQDPSNAGALSARVLTYDPAVGGWIESLAAGGAANRWEDVAMTPADVTGDGVPELLAGFRSPSEERSLETDIVGYSGEGTPEVLAHLGAAPSGSVVVADGGLDVYGGVFPNDQPSCCPPVFEARQVRFDGAVFRVVASAEVVPSDVPPSQV